MSATDRFEAHRDRLFGVAYRMTGAVTDAEDCVQEAFVRWQRIADESGLDDIDNDEAYLVRVVTRLAIDRQRRVAARRETYVGPWLPEPLITDIGGDPADAAELADSLSFAFLVMLDRLSPAERAAFILHDIFGVPFDEIAGTLDRETEACRQLASRARRKLRDAAPTDTAEHADTNATIAALLTALFAGDVEGCLAHLAPGVILTSDAGPHRRAARRQVVGADRVGRLILNIFARDSMLVSDMRAVLVNGSPGLLIGHQRGPMVFTGDVGPDGRVERIWIQMNPDKLPRVTSPDHG